VCSPYNFFGPHCGFIASDPALLETLHPDKLLPSTDVIPERFELGTLPYELPTLLFSVTGHPSSAVQSYLAGLDVNAPSGSFYALQASRSMGLDDTGAVRVALAPYTDSLDIARLVEGLRRFITER
jgi:selenocysteine lyase/cysteine desulfurase